MIVMGIDPGLTGENPTGVAIIDPEKSEILAHFTLPQADQKTDWPEAIWEIRLSLIVTRLRDAMVGFNQDIALIGYEIPFISTYKDAQGVNRYSANLAIKLAHVGGAIVALAALAEIPVFPIMPSDAKEAVGGNPNSMKFQIRQAVEKRFSGVEEGDLSYHEADAVAVALAALRCHQSGAPSKIKNWDPPTP